MEYNTITDNSTKSFDNDTSFDEGEKRGLWIQFFYPFLLALLILVTSVGNGIILISFALEPALRKLDNAFIISLSIADFIVGVVVMPMYAVWEVSQEWQFLEVGCYLWQQAVSGRYPLYISVLDGSSILFIVPMIVDCVSSTASFWTLLAMAIDRYITVRQPFNKLSEGRRKRVIAFITLVWLLPLLYWVPSLVIIPITFNLDLVANCESTFKEFTLVTSIVIYNLPTLLMIVFYTLIIYEVRKVNLSPNNSFFNKEHLGSPGLEKRADKCQNPVILTGIVEKLSGEESHSDCSGFQSQGSDSGNSIPTTSSKSGADDGNSQKNVYTISGTNKTSNYAIQMQQKRLQQETRIRNKQQHHTVRMLGTIMGCFLLCWLLWDINWPLAWYLPETAIPEALHHVACWLAYGNSAINPFVYCFSNPMFWKSIRKVLLCKSKKCCSH